MVPYRAAVALLGCLLPGRAKRLLYRWLLHYEIGSAARIGFSLILADHCTLGDGARIGHLNVIGRCESVTLGDHAIIGNLNWISAHPKADKTFYSSQADRSPSLTLGRHAAITSRHLIDCAAHVSVGAFATIGGSRSQLWTHSVDFVSSVQVARGISIGTYSFVATSTVLLPGASLPDFSVLAAGSVLRNDFKEPYGLYAGHPAVRVKELSEDMAYFRRDTGPAG